MGDPAGMTGLRLPQACQPSSPQVQLFATHGVSATTSVPCWPFGDGWSHRGVAVDMATGPGMSSHTTAFSVQGVKKQITSLKGQRGGTNYVSMETQGWDELVHYSWN